MTARALELIAAADVIVYDRLIPAPRSTARAPTRELIYAGKEGGGPVGVAGGDRPRCCVEHAARVGSVVRLKGGDPFVFGRGGEEAEALRDAGIEFEVVPGVTAGVAAPAYAGIPVTHRDAASAVAFVTGHEDPDKPESALDWRRAGRVPGDARGLHGRAPAGAIAERLIAGGRDGAQPAAIIERGTLAGQRVVTATLATLAEQAAAAGIRAPAIAVFGEVAALRDRLQWLERRPLAGVSVAVTRARAQASGLASRLQGLGAAVIEAPAIRISPLRGRLPDLCALRPGVPDQPQRRAAAAGADGGGGASTPARSPGARIAAIGPGTAAALRERGLIADVVPERFVAEGLVEALADVPVSRALVARAAEARDVLPDALRERGAEVDVVALYETVAETALGRGAVGAGRRRLRDVHLVLDGALSVRGDRRPPGAGRAAGQHRPGDQPALRERGLEPDVEAVRHDIDGVVEALVADVGLRRGLSSRLEPHPALREPRFAAGGVNGWHSIAGRRRFPEGGRECMQ